MLYSFQMVLSWSTGPLSQCQSPLQWCVLANACSLAGVSVAGATLTTSSVIGLVLPSARWLWPSWSPSRGQSCLQFESRKVRVTTFPLKALKEMRWPVWSVRVKSGAACAFGGMTMSAASPLGTGVGDASRELLASACPQAASRRAEQTIATPSLTLPSAARENIWNTAFLLTIRLIPGGRRGRRQIDALRDLDRRRLRRGEDHRRR